MIVLLALCLSGIVVPASAQDAAVPARAGARAPLLLIYLDCDYSCDKDYLRQNVNFVDYVRDRAVADVHVLVATESNGSGGTLWTVRFIGLGRFQGQERPITFTTPSTATTDDRRREFARVFKIGLVGYAADTSIAPELDVTFMPATGASTAALRKDPWNFWVFQINANGFMNGEQSSQSGNYSLSFSANRTTNNWKLNVSSNFNENTNSFSIDAATKVRSQTHSWNVNSLMVKSLGPKWSYGGTASVAQSSFSNIAHSYSAMPGVEYDFFRYSESSKRHLSVQYTVGPTHYDYVDMTIYDQLTETIPRHSLTSSLGLQQPWGSIGVSSTFSQELNHFDRKRESVFINTAVRLFKGFSFNILGQYSRIGDQSSLKKDAATEADVLLRTQQLQTNYNYFLNFGINYSFGSIFNSVVNPRFGF
jgi:hypothetical protein